MAVVIDRKRAKLNPSGGSRSVIVPKSWLRRLGLETAVEIELTLTEEGIGLGPIASGSLEDDPDFPAFLNFLQKTAVRHPELLTDASEFYDEARELLGKKE